MATCPKNESRPRVEHGRVPEPPRSDTRDEALQRVHRALLADPMHDHHGLPRSQRLVTHAIRALPRPEACPTLNPPGLRARWRLEDEELASSRSDCMNDGAARTERLGLARRRYEPGTQTGRSNGSASSFYPVPAVLNGSASYSWLTRGRITSSFPRTREWRSPSLRSPGIRGFVFTTRHARAIGRSAVTDAYAPS